MLHFAQTKAIRRRAPAANARLFEQPDGTRWWTVDLFDPTVPNGRQFGLPDSVVLRASREIGMIVAHRELAKLAARVVVAGAT